MIAPLATARSADPGLSHFRQLLWDLLERYQIHFRGTRSLHLTIDARDRHKLPALFRGLHQRGYHPIQAGRRAGGACACRFAWLEGQAAEGAALKMATVHIAIAGGWFGWGPFGRGGVCLMLLGPDGVGKSTLIDGLQEALAPVFGRQQVFHWRPGLALPIRDDDDSPAGPHADPPRGALLSVCYLLGFFADFCLGRALRVRPLLAQSGLIIFDRYFPDLMVDRQRYRYAGPEWLVRALWKLLERRGDLALILTGAPEAIFRRKQQLPLEELARQTARYRALSAVLHNAHVIETADGIAATRAAALQAVVEHLSRRFLERL